MKRKITIPLLTIILVMTMGIVASDISYGQNIAWGSSGAEVRELQNKLKSWGYFDGAVDGVYGAKTYEAVKLFQKKNGLTADGVVGSQTRAALGMPSKSTAPNTSVSRGVSRSDDVNLLARTIHAESKGEPYEGQVAVGAVILNRVKSSKFPNTLAGVVYQPCAFEPVKRGTINEAPNEAAYKAARDAINGWDPTGGALYFWNPATSSSPWIWSRTITLKIGDHVFGN